MKDVEKYIKTGLKIIEFLIVGNISFNIASTVYEIFFAISFDAVIRLMAGVAKWTTFFLCLYLYYKYVKKRLKIKLS